MERAKSYQQSYQYWHTLLICLGACGVFATSCENDPFYPTPRDPVSLLRVDPIADGEVCANGGSAVSSGIDRNVDGILQEEEIQSAAFVCNGADGDDGQNGQNGQDGQDGQDGQNPDDPDDGDPIQSIAPPSVLRIDVEPSGANCAAGGLAIHVGQDLDGDQTLNDNEIQQTSYVCNGSDGVDGADANPVSRDLVLVVPEPSGERCAFGGAVIQQGTDVNQDGQLQSSEVSSENLVCGGPSDDGIVECDANDVVAEGTFALIHPEDIDLLQGVTCLRGNLLIDNSDMTSLQGLESLEKIVGSVVISNNADLTTLNGMDHIERIAGTLLLQNNAVLQDIQALSSLQDVGVRLAILTNPALPNVSGLAGLQELSASLEITNNTALTSLSGLENLQRARRNFFVVNNDALTDADAVQSLQIVDGSIAFNANDHLDRLQFSALREVNSSLSVQDNLRITSIEMPELRQVVVALRLRNNAALQQAAYPLLSSIGSDVEIFDNLQLQTVDCPRTLFVGRALLVQNNAQLQNLNFSALVTVGDDVSLRSNPRMTSLASFQSLRSVGDDLAIRSMAGIANIDGFQSVGSVGGALQIIDNTQLTTVTGFQSIRTVGRNVEVTGNRALPTSAAQSLAAGMSVGGQVVIANNGAG